MNTKLSILKQTGKTNIVHNFFLKCIYTTYILFVSVDVFNQFKKH